MRPAHHLRTLLPGLVGVACLAVLAAGCGRDENDERDDAAQPPPPRPTPSAAISDGVITAQLLSIHRSQEWAEALVRLENDSADPVDLVNLGDTLTGFSLVVGGVPTSARTQVAGEAVAAASLSTLPAHVPVELVLYWHLSHPARHDDYPCTVVISNLFQKGRHLPDVLIQVDGFHAHAAPPPPPPPGSAQEPAGGGPPPPGPAPATPGSGVSM